MLKKLIKNERGLTLVELLAVIVILGIIAAIAIPSIGKVIQNSREDAVRADAIQVLNSADLYISSKGIPADGSLDAADLGTYVKNTDKLDTGWTVNVSTDGNTVTFNGKGHAGSQVITFTNASVKAINSDNGNGSHTIQ
ncbi:prepilin-type N-terminal cleavage/methylation domain-containing protein [Bacillus sp. AFS017336]|uniref:prepilin-type N-terminal cleavage/methylation domain-containing protein n=1 Tax=Bacillus sp. AFS017336 TaxID=2033489 RepID=UPI000BF07818|nr:prepilin-type N-terminal cleavage/methylation domain-containing protein [Bacillus sp. AFS017336]PEL13437.1 prepilin-type cleavage/methylation domain-containing protein [Bacillus sp. AFS017336]